MEINSGLVNLTTVERSRLLCAGVEAALAALMVLALVKAQLASLGQEYMTLLMNQPNLRGDHHTSCPSEVVDAENDDGDEEEENDEGEDDETPINGNKTGAKDVPGGVEENGNDEDEEEGEEPNEDEDDDNDEDDEDDEEDDGGEDDDEEEDEEEEEEEEDEEDALQPPKKRKK